jgi:hypothetical protein
MFFPQKFGIGKSIMLTAWVAVACGCSSVHSRIEQNRPQYSTWPLEVREKIAAGKVDVGFTPQQVRVALGEPDYISTRTTADGTTEVWGYRERGPRFGFGVGVGSFGGHGATSIGVATNSSARDDEKLRVVFDRNGKVSSIEEAQRRR